MCKLAILTPLFNEGLNSTWTKCSHDGWKTLIVPEDDEQYKVVHFKLHGVQNNKRATQEEILGQFDKPSCPTTAIAMQKDCETEAFRLIILLTSQLKRELMYCHVIHLSI